MAALTEHDVRVFAPAGLSGAVHPAQGGARGGVRGRPRSLGGDRSGGRQHGREHAERAQNVRTQGQRRSGAGGARNKGPRRSNWKASLSASRLRASRPRTA